MPTPGEVLAAYKASRAQRVALARLDPAAFTELVLKDEATGQPVVLAAIHEEWHSLASKHDRLVIQSFVESGKSSALTVARTLWELGRNPSLRAAVVSNTHGQAAKLVRSIAAYIEQSPELREVFPGLVPATPWTDSALTVQRPTLTKDPSVQAFGVHGAVIGSRLDLLVVDDCVDWENARTLDQRQELVSWFLATLMGRLTAKAKVIVVGTAFHPEDLLHRLSASGWPSFRFPITTDDGQPRWPQRWSLERIAEKRLELGPAEAARQLDVMTRNDADSRFKQEWIDVALQRGQGRTCLGYLLNGPLGARVVHGVDLAVSKKSTADLSVIVTLLIHADKSRQILSIQSGRWSGPEIVSRIADTQRKFGGTVVVETVQAQAYVSQFLRELNALPVVDFRTGRGHMSLDWQVETLAAEMARGQWIIPSDGGNKPNNAEVAALLRDLLFYDPRRHTADRIAACCFARYGADLGARRAEFGQIDLLSR
jgi:hypothetical protein